MTFSHVLALLFIAAVVLFFPIAASGLMVTQYPLTFALFLLSAGAFLFMVETNGLNQGIQQ